MIADFLFGLSLIFIMIILLAAVMSICPKWGFALASREVKEAMKDYPAPVKERKIAGAIIVAVCMTAFAAVIIYAGIDGNHNGFSFFRMWIRFMIIFYVEKAFDLFVLDYLWVKKSGWFQRNFAELRDSDIFDRFQVFRREQIIRLISFPFICALLSGIFFIGK